MSLPGAKYHKTKAGIQSIQECYKYYVQKYYTAIRVTPSQPIMMEREEKSQALLSKVIKPMMVEREEEFLVLQLKIIEESHGEW